MQKPNSTKYLEKFISNSSTDINAYTVNQIFNRHFARYWKTRKIKIIFPEIVNDLSASSRMRIARIVENHFYPATELPSQSILSFLKHFEHYPSDYQIVWREYNACLFATNYDEDAAAATFLQNGPILGKESIRGAKNRVKCVYISCVRVTQSEDGINLNFCPSFDLGPKISAAYSMIYEQYHLHLNQVYSADDIDDFITTSIVDRAFTEFFSGPAHHIMSVPREFSASLRAGLEDYLKVLKRTPRDLLETIPPTTMNVPQEWLPLTTQISENIDIFLPFSDFKIELTSAAQRAHLFDLAYDKTLATLAEKYAEHPEWDATTIYPSSQVRGWFHRHTLDAATDPLKNFIVKVAYGKYQFNFINILKAGAIQENNDEDDFEDDDVEPLIF